MEEKKYKIFPWIRNILIFVGLQVDEPNFKSKYLRVCFPYIMRIFNFGYLWGFVYVQTLYVLDMFETENVDIDALTDYFIYAYAIFIITFKYILILYYQKKLNILVHGLDSHVTERIKIPGRLKIYDDIETKVYKVVKGLFYLLVIFPIGLILVNPFIQIIMFLFNRKNFQYVRHLPTAIKLWYNVNESPYFEITFLLEMPIFVTGYINEISINALIIGLSGYLVAISRDLKIMIQDIDDNGSIMEIQNDNENSIEEIQQKRRTKLLNCIYFHRKLLDLWYLCQDVCNGPAFVQGAFNSLLICLIVYKISIIEVTAKNANLPVYFFMITADLLGTTASGQFLYDDMESISTVLYNTNWYEYDAHGKYLFHLMLMRSQKIQYFSGFKFFTLNMQTFKNVMGTVASIYTMLKSMSE